MVTTCSAIVTCASEQQSSDQPEDLYQRQVSVLGGSAESLIGLTCASAFANQSRTRISSRQPMSFPEFPLIG
jgi:hypothetical protein